MVVAYAILKAKIGKEKELENALLTLIPEVKKEKGTVEYKLNRGIKDTGAFYFYEKYTNQAALDFHMSTPHIVDIIGRFEELLAEAPQIEAFEEIASIN